MQGPFTNLEMAEWFKAGYFSNQLKIRRAVDDRFFLLGEIVALCAGGNPFTCGIRFPVQKNDVGPAMPKMVPPTAGTASEVDMMQQFQYLQMALKHGRVPPEHWGAAALSMQQRQELAAQRMLMQQVRVWISFGLCGCDVKYLH